MVISLEQRKMKFNLKSNLTCNIYMYIGVTRQVVVHAHVHPGGGGGTPLYGLYGDVPLDRVWFLASSVLNRVYNFMRTCPKQGMFF